MPVLANPRHEAFVQYLFQGLEKKTAYVMAGYTDSEHSCRSATALSNVPLVASRLSELQASAAEAAAVTVESIAAQLDEDRRLAYELGQPAAAITATMGKAKLYGLLTEKVEATVRHSFADLSDEELDYEIAKRIDQAKEVGGHRVIAGEAEKGG